MAETKITTISNERTELFWDDLLAFIEERKVIPVLGRELITVTDNNEDIPLYRAIAHKLLIKFGIVSNPVMLRPHQELNDAVAILIRKGKRIQDLYRPIHDLMHQTIPDQSLASRETLRDLAGIADFDLFICTTFDDMFLETLNEVRCGSVTDPIIYSPTNLIEKERRDIPEIMSSAYYTVFYLFGRASASSLYAIHDEDILEFMYHLLARSCWVPERMIAEMLNRNLLLIGCDFADWLSRFFIRLSNQERLRSERVKKEFLVGNKLFKEKSLTLFLEHFSHNSRLYPYDPHAFVKELSRRWHERNLSAGSSNFSFKSAGVGDTFISYSRVDQHEVRFLFEELKEIGVDIPWFDKEQLKPGDVWDPKIRTAITRCRLFLAVFSYKTKTDGFVQEEWKEAINQIEWSSEKKLKIIPVIIENDIEVSSTVDDIIPPKFRSFQAGYAPGGHLSDELKTTIITLLREIRGWQQ